MTPALGLARALGIRVSFADLGDWGSAQLRSEYDARHRVIRINARVVEGLEVCNRDEFVALAIGHELYHFYEHAGEIAVLPERKQREMAADSYARELLGRGS